MTQHAVINRLGVLWTVKSEVRQVVTAYETRDAAIAAARSLLRGAGGGEIVIPDADGQVTTETVASSA